MLKIIHEPSLSKLTTMRIGGKAIAEICIMDGFDEHKLSYTIKELGGDVFVLGAGSNILASDNDLNVLLLRPKFSPRIEVLDSNEKQTLVFVTASTRLAKFIGKCASLGLSGLEGLCGIPGTVGGAIAMNAGSFGTETCAHLHSIQIYSPQTGITTINADELNYTYRKLCLEKINSWFFIISASFILTNSETTVIKEKMFLNFVKKKSTQPVNAWSAGCLFKNPTPENPAGKLLDLCGFKGKTKGGMIFSPLHANFLINQGQGNANAAFDLMEEAKEAVYKSFDIRLAPEVKILWP